MTDLFSDLFGSLGMFGKNSRTGKKIEIHIKPGEYKYRYFQSKDSSVMFCYTPHPDTEGWYHSFIYKPLGAGARTGKAKRWKLVSLISHRTRKAAKARALGLHEKESK